MSRKQSAIRSRECDVSYNHRAHTRAAFSKMRAASERFRHVSSVISLDDSRSFSNMACICAPNSCPSSTALTSWLFMHRIFQLGEYRLALRGGERTLFAFELHRVRRLHRHVRHHDGNQAAAREERKEKRDSRFCDTEHTFRPIFSGAGLLFCTLPHGDVARKWLT